MNKELLISIKPEHLVNILNRKKTLELRKTVPKNYKGWVYIYCTKNGDNLVYNGKSYQLEKGKKLDYDLNGKVVARFWFDEYEGVDYQRTVLSKNIHETLDRKVIIRLMGTVKYILDDDILDKLCLTYDEVENYGKGEDLYAWLIKKLEIFDNPMELSEFYRKERKDDIEVDVVSSDGNFVRLSRPPQSWQYIFSIGTGEEHV